MAALSASLGTTSNRETMTASNGMEVIVVTTLRKDPKDPKKFYTDVDAIIVP